MIGVLACSLLLHRFCCHQELGQQLRTKVDALKCCAANCFAKFSSWWKQFSFVVTWRASANSGHCCISKTRSPMAVVRAGDQTYAPCCLFWRLDIFFCFPIYVPVFSFFLLFVDFVREIVWRTILLWMVSYWVIKPVLTRARKSKILKQTRVGKLTRQCLKSKLLLSKAHKVGLDEQLTNETSNNQSKQLNCNRPWSQQLLNWFGKLFHMASIVLNQAH